MKIALITYHHVSNYGSVLQAYATQRLLESLGAEVSVVDYVNAVNLPNRRLRNLVLDSKYGDGGGIASLAFRAASWPDVRRAESVFDDFRARRLNLTSRCYDSVQAGEVIGDFDAFCTGSDQVWNPHSSSTSLGLDPVFFLSFAPPGAPRFSLSSTFGTASLTSRESMLAANYLRSYRRISVRDQGSLRILHEMGLSGELVLDPTALVDHTTWTSLGKPTSSRPPYVLIYQLHDSPSLGGYAHRVAEDLGLQVRRLSFFWRNSLRRERIDYLPSPEVFISLIRDASLVVTDSFHGTVFASLLRTPFACFLSDAFSHRLHDYLTLIHQQGRIVSDPEDLSVARSTIDWGTVDDVLRVNRDASLRWLLDTFKELAP